MEKDHKHYINLNQSQIVKQQILLIIFWQFSNMIVVQDDSVLHLSCDYRNYKRVAEFYYQRHFVSKSTIPVLVKQTSYHIITI